MPSFLFRMKRRQSEATLKPPQNVNVEVDVEPLPHPPSKFRSMMGSGGLFTRSNSDLRRSSRLQSLSNLLQPVPGRPRAATTTVKIVAGEDPSLVRHVAEMPRDKETSSVRRTSGESSSVSGHSDRGFQSAKLPKGASPKRTPLPPQQDMLPSPSEPEETAETALSSPLSQPPLSIDTARDAHQHDNESIASSVSPGFYTPPQRMGEEQHSRPVDLALISEPSSAVPAYDHAENVQRRGSTMSNVSSEGGVRSPRKMSLVLHSAPIPLPIAHLPTMTEPSSPTGQHTPWGDLAKSGGPKSSSARAGGPGASFPWTGVGVPPVPTVPRATEGGEDLSDAEVQNVTKGMPVMLRVSSRRASAVVDDGGDAGDSDSEDDDAAPVQPRPIATPKNNGEGSGPSSLASSTRSALGLFNQPTRHISPLASSSALQALQREAPRTDTPTNDSINDDDDSDNDSNEQSEEQDTPATSIAITTPPITSPTSNPLRPPLYSHASRSMINLPSTSPFSAITRPLLEPVKEARPLGSPFRSSPEPPVASPPLVRKRRLSDGDANPLPPKYEALATIPGLSPKPREEEGRERLPGYWCGVHIEGTLSRKMEFTQPGMQAKDRAWKKYYFVLHGTALHVYKFDPTKVPLRANEPYLACDENEIQQFLHVHPAPDRRFLASIPINTPSAAPHTPVSRSEKQARRNTIVSIEGALRASPIGALAHRRGTVGTQTPPMRQIGPSSSPMAGSSSSAGPSALSASVPPYGGETRDAKNPELFSKASRRKSMMAAAPVASSTASAPLASHMPFAHNMLVHKYTLQSAESGLAADYKKRLHCVRIRAEGQQFLLQTETARQCVQWIEAFQAATNVALDLDARPMPVQQTLPRRRRRPGQRRAAAAAAAAAGAAAAEGGEASNPAFEDTPEGNIAAVEAAQRLERERQDRERERMLAEDQAANTGGFHT